MSISNAFNGMFALMLLMLLGVFMTKKNFLTEDYYHFLTSFIMKYSVPALLFQNAIKNVTADFMGVAKLLKLDRSLQGIFISIFAMCNTMLMGFPICMQIFGEVSLPYVTAYYIANTVVFWVLVAPRIAAGGEAQGSISLKDKIWSISLCPSLCKQLLLILAPSPRPSPCCCAAICWPAWARTC